MGLLGNCMRCHDPGAEGQPRFWADDDGYLCGSCAIDFLVHERNAALKRAEGAEERERVLRRTQARIADGDERHNPRTGGEATPFEMPALDPRPNA